MNFLAHGIRFVDRPWFLVGTAVPDLLSVADRRVRVRERHLVAFDEQECNGGDPLHELAGGVRQHLVDDDWFHRTVGFHEVTGRLATMFREAVGTDGFRCGFLGHIACEMLIDAVLTEQSPGLLDAYYEALADVDPARVERMVNGIAPRQTDRLAAFLVRFREARFLYDYGDSDRFLYRLNQVLQRVKLTPLPPPTADVVERGRGVVRDALERLLPAEHFTPQPPPGTAP